MANNTGTVETEKQGTVLYFNGESFPDFRDFPKDLDLEDEVAWDLHRANQALKDVRDAAQRGMEFVIDYEHYGHNNPVPVGDYIAVIVSFIAEI